MALVKAGFTAQADDVLARIEAHLSNPAYGSFGEGTVLSANGTLSLKNKKTGGRMMDMMTLGKDLGDTSLVSTMDALFNSTSTMHARRLPRRALRTATELGPYVLGGTTANWTTRGHGHHRRLLSPN